ncbi:MAG TPA: STAS domain-containing protein [Stellaceae bacterium]|jgi:anti-sigma B factor antagonist|nr:STAS domain-containing protein [Stellaceae bacterium]
MEMSMEDLPGGATLVVLRGRLDVAGASAIELKFNATAGARKAMVVDLSGVSFVASMGMRLLLLVGKTMSARGGKMALLSPLPEVASVLHTAGIDTVIPVCTARDEAVAKVAA